ncbi:hypothetical protein Q3G72_009530 [Acer saccharum]|nr:hypothetical protein Q3G72_009530 [Acer saccharum]
MMLFVAARRGVGAALLALGVCTFWAPCAQAAGLFLAPRGVRALARAGAFVAGADDVHALSYNPAGLARARHQLVLDAALPIHDTSYTRSILGDGNYEPVSQGRGLGVPSPTLGVVHDLGLSKYGLGFGLSVSADYPLMQNWADPTDTPLAPQRYAIGSFDGTAMARVAAGVGYRPWPLLAVGASLQLLVGSFNSQSTISTCDGASCIQPENPSYDAVIAMQAKNIVVPGAAFGLKLHVRPWLVLGASWETGYTIAQQARVRIRLPTAPIYANAVLDPPEPVAKVTMRLPQTARLGVEARKVGLGCIELSAVFEPWHVHDSIDVALQTATLRQVLALDTYSIGNISLARGFRDTYSVRLGGEWTPSFGFLAGHHPLSVRAGAMFEPSAISVDMMTPMSVDLDKILASVGGALQLGRWQVEVAIAHVFMWDRLVTDSKVYQVNPVRPAFTNVTAIGNGHYQSHATILGAGVRLAL